MPESHKIQLCFIRFRYPNIIPLRSKIKKKVFKNATPAKFEAKKVKPSFDQTLKVSENFFETDAIKVQKISSSAKCHNANCHGFSSQTNSKP